MISDTESIQSSKAAETKNVDVEEYLNDHRLQGGLPLKDDEDLSRDPNTSRRYSISDRRYDDDLRIDMNRMKITGPAATSSSGGGRLGGTTGTSTSAGATGGGNGTTNGTGAGDEGSKRQRHNSTKSIDSSIRRKISRSSIDSDPDSHASRSSQETEEDVCFPMLREHVRIKGIDFDEIEEFIKDELNEKSFYNQAIVNESNLIKKNSITPQKVSSTSIKYSPKYLLSKLTTRKTVDENIIPEDFNVYDKLNLSTDSDNTSSDQVKFGQTRIQSEENLNVTYKQLPPRFSFFNSENEETIHSPDIPGLLAPGQSVQQLFNNGDGTWWLDCSCPTDSETKMLAKAFGIHPLTAEDIRMQETREKVELFRNYYFVCFHTFEQDNESEDYLEPINVYIVVFREGILTFHYSPINHPANVRRRVRQLRDYVDVSADWLCYALIDDITDAFAPVITGIEYEADMIEDSVFVARESDFAIMLRKIGQARRKVMTLMRLLAGKADVIKMFAKRCQDEATTTLPPIQPNFSNLNHCASPQPFAPMSGIVSPQPINLASNLASGPAMSSPMSPPPQSSNSQTNINYSQFQRVQQPRADIALYLGDIQDHVVTMFQNLLAYEKIFSRSHGNYLAQLQVESFNSNNKMTSMFSKVTIIGTILIPLNVVTGLFGMNVHVPGEGGDTLAWFFGIIGFMIVVVSTFLYLGHLWLRKLDKPEPVGASSRTIKSFKLRQRTKDAAKSIISFPNKYD